MSARKEDPRAIRSKRLLKEAVISLLIESQNLQELTVQKITAKAELNRATFYLHYVDMQDLLKHVVYDIFDDLSKKLSPLLQPEHVDLDEHRLTFLDYFYQHRKYLSVLFEEKAFQKKLHNFIVEFVQARRDLNKIVTEDAVSKDIIASSILGILMWWIRDGKHYSSEYIAHQMSVWMTRRY
ncbi:TetR-like C-terminal domain-containing protein [Neobacillus sp. YX16]|uniref:TetR/AcrR family transcriptional regulator n=1 Tax=Neobacillus sp. YX16 TaxID=3047874 RepID=UPI0010595B59|nr:TetR-like C-terminal domain-containing protein [Neobacillus sp. YX16]TDL61301.1 TetR/AcrR family transcriptional regulator [Rhodococcus qingshengii]WHZ03423.1 TetR-like C-terminal domain-containing protein [Neobacillus sp. YX16]